jgi:hypothetical protein
MRDVVKTGECCTTCEQGVRYRLAKQFERQFGTVNADRLREEPPL